MIGKASGGRQPPVDENQTRTRHPRIVCILKLVKRRIIYYESICDLD